MLLPINVEAVSGAILTKVTTPLDNTVDTEPENEVTSPDNPGIREAATMPVMRSFALPEVAIAARLDVNTRADRSLDRFVIRLSGSALTDQVVPPDTVTSP